jgi:hypothetical protein
MKLNYRLIPVIFVIVLFATVVIYANNQSGLITGFYVSEGGAQAPTISSSASILVLVFICIGVLFMKISFARYDK